MLAVVLGIAIAIPLSLHQSPLNALSITFVALYAVAWTYDWVYKARRRSKDRRGQ
jgi:uncharacterized membrane protein